MTSNKRLANFSAVIDDFSSAPFRLFFLTGCVAATIAALCWPLAMLGWWAVPTDPLNLHVFFFLQFIYRYPGMDTRHHTAETLYTTVMGTVAVGISYGSLVIAVGADINGHLLVLRFAAGGMAGMAKTR